MYIYPFTFDFSPTIPILPPSLLIWKQFPKPFTNNLQTICKQLIIQVINTPEVVRVYVGSFWDKPLVNADFEDLFRKEHADLLSDLHSLPGSSVVRRVNEVVKRARSAKTHALLVDHLRHKLPFFGKEGAMKKLMEKPGKLEEEFQNVSRKYNVPLVSIYVWMHVGMYVCMHVGMHECMYVFMYVGM
jgi:hypothetical protein